jgi:hypothetical protein
VSTAVRLNVGRYNNLREPSFRSSVQHILFKWHKLRTSKLLLLSIIFVHKFELFSLLTYYSIYIRKASTSCVALMVKQFSLQSRVLQEPEIYSTVVLFILLLYTHYSRGSDTWPFLLSVLPIGYCPMLCYMAACRAFSILSQCYPCAVYKWYTIRVMYCT